MEIVLLFFYNRFFVFMFKHYIGHASEIVGNIDVK